MKKIAIIILAVFINNVSHSQDIQGTWYGSLEVQKTKLPLVFHIVKSDNQFTATMDSPNQGAKGIPISSTTIINNELKLEISSAGIMYEGTLKNGQLISGTFNQAGKSFPLDLTQASPENKIQKKPQEPIKPYPYYSENIAFENYDDNITLAGTLTFPKKGNNFPAVILISGSGPQNRDEEILGHKPFLVLADYLTRKGIAVLRYDDRGTAKSTGNFATSTSWDLARDAKAAFNYLSTRNEINKEIIGMIGHSEGGVIAPLVASDNPNINFIVLLAGPGIRGYELLLQQQKLIAEASGISRIKIEQNSDVYKGAFNILLKNKSTEEERVELTQYFKRLFNDMPINYKPGGINDEDYIEMQVSQLTSPWMNYFIKYNPGPILTKVKCPVLALNGEKDLQVAPKANLEAIENAVKGGGNTKITVTELANLNHLFQECNTGLPGEYGTIQQTFSPLALETISKWILETIE